MLHVDVPTDMVGGQIMAWPGLTVPVPVRDMPAEIFPAKNTVLVMRGDSEYLIKPFTSPSGDKSLISLIVEQYKIPDRNVQDLVEYCLGDQCA